MSPHTRNAYLTDLRGFALWLAGRGSSLRQAGREAILDHLGWRLQQGYQARSTARLLSALRTFYRYLLRERLIFDRFHLHILQCDCEVQQDTLVTNLEEFQWYLDHLELYGGGGTDFRPALRRIDELVACGELPHLGGVLYFTDGYGVFPEREPAYPVAFVMLRYRYDDINIPRWAIRLVLDADKPGRDEGWI